MSKHTPGPWVAHVSKADEFTSNDVMLIRSQEPLYGVAGIEIERDVDEANAARIVACVNACEGIEDPSVVPEMLAALKSAHYWICSDISLGEMQSTRDMLSAIIARAEGRK
jgi:hypothetical protein